MLDFVHRLAIRTLLPQRLRLMHEVSDQVRWPAEKQRAYQAELLRRLISYCWKYVPYYRERWQNHISGPEDIRGVADLVRLPILSKDDLRAELPRITTTDRANLGEPARSGGSTGRPTAYRLTRFDQEMAWAQAYTGWSWAGFRVGDPFLLVGGESIGVGLSDRRVLKDRIMNRWHTSGSNISPERAKALAESWHFHRITFICGYPNAIRELSELLASLRAMPRALRGVVCTAEVMRPDVREAISANLGHVPVLDQYGMNDGGLLAVEGSEQDGLHVFFRRGLLEILDDDNRQITEPGRVGRAVATSLTNLATPFVRYETGDEVHWRTFEPAPSGVTLPRIGPVDGRTGDVIYLPTGRRIAMPGLTLVMRWIEGLQQYQFIQTGPRNVAVVLDTGPLFAMSEVEVVALLREKIAAEVEWSVRWGKPELTQNHKLLVIRNDWLRAHGLSRPPGRFEEQHEC